MQLRKYSVAEKLQIVEETRANGASVADVGRAHGINANIVFGWRRLAQRGLLRAPGAESAPLLPVKVESPTLLPTVKTPASEARTRERGIIEIEFSGGIRVRLQGAVDALNQALQKGKLKPGVKAGEIVAWPVRWTE